MKVQNDKERTPKLMIMGKYVREKRVKCTSWNEERPQLVLAGRNAYNCPTFPVSEENQIIRNWCAYEREKPANENSFVVSSFSPSSLCSL